MSTSKPERAIVKIIQEDVDEADIHHWRIEARFRTFNREDMVRVVEAACNAINRELAK